MFAVLLVIATLLAWNPEAARPDKFRPPSQSSRPDCPLQGRPLEPEKGLEVWQQPELRRVPAWHWPAAWRRTLASVPRLAEPALSAPGRLTPQLENCRIGIEKQPP